MNIDSGGVDIHFEVHRRRADRWCCSTASPTRDGCGATRSTPWPPSGFQVIVPDLRGYGSSGKPAEVEAYSLVHLAGDVLAVLDHLGLDRAHVVGHDWGRRWPG